MVFEAWQEATESARLDEIRFVEHLRQINQPPLLIRRIGAMLHLLRRSPGPELDRLLSGGKDSIDRKSAHSQISLLPGFDYANLDKEWLVQMP